MRTTVDIPDVIYRRLKSRAAHQGRSVKSLLLEAAEQMLEQSVPKRRRVKLPLIKSKEPGALHLTNEMIEAFLIQDDLSHLAGR